MYWPTPPESPDLNPIEMVWHEMKHYLRKYAKLKAELEQGIYNFWATMTPAKCAKYIGHLRKSCSGSDENERQSIRILTLKLFACT